MASMLLFKTIFGGFIWISICLKNAALSTSDFNNYLRILNNTSLSFSHPAVATSDNAPKIEEKIMTTEYAWAIIKYTYKNDNNELEHYSAKVGRYGEGKVLNASGFLIHISSETDKSDDKACSDKLRGTNGIALPPKTAPWIALVKRGDCTFDNKVKNVFNQGASGVIIYDNKHSNYIEKMHISDTEREIAAVLIYKKVGDEMAKLADKGFQILASINAGPREIRTLSTLNKTSVLFVSVSFIVLMIISLVWLVVYYIQRFRYLQSKDLQSRNLCTMAKKVIMKIPTRSGKSDDKDNDNDCCAICIETYKSSDTVRILPCKHEFHKNCIDPWLIEHRTCPMCKLDVLKYYGFVYFGSEESIIDFDPQSLDEHRSINYTGNSNRNNFRRRDNHCNYYFNSIGVAIGNENDFNCPRERSQSLLLNVSNDEPVSNMVRFQEERNRYLNLDFKHRLKNSAASPLQKRRSKSADGLLGNRNSHQHRERQSNQLKASKKHDVHAKVPNDKASHIEIQIEICD